MSLYVSVQDKGLCVFLTFLVSNGAGSFARGLTGCLTLAAAALFGSLFKVSLVDSFDMFHNYIPP